MPAFSRLIAALLGSGWIILLFVTLHALQRMGATAAIDIFLGDFAHPWRAQFNTDFAMHLLIFASWIYWRTASNGLGLILATLSVFCGGLFNIAYLLVALVRARGDMKALLLGCHAVGEARI